MQREIGAPEIPPDIHEDFLSTILDVLEMRMESELLNGTALESAERCSIFATCLANTPGMEFEFGALGDAFIELRR